MKKRTKIGLGVVAAALAIGLGAKYISPKEAVGDDSDSPLIRAIQSSSHDYPTVISNLQMDPSIENAEKAIGESRTSFVYMFPYNMSPRYIFRRTLAYQYIRDSDDLLAALDKVEGYDGFIEFNKAHITDNMGLAEVIGAHEVDPNKLSDMVDERIRYFRSKEYEGRKARAIAEISGLLN